MATSRKSANAAGASFPAALEGAIRPDGLRIIRFVMFCMKLSGRKIVAGMPEARNQLFDGVAPLGKRFVKLARAEGGSLHKMAYAVLLTCRR
jgi:hypothetical protein